MSDRSQWLNVQQALGPDGRLGVAARLFRPERAIPVEIAFNADDLFPMASTAKIAIAMLAASSIASGALSLTEQITINPNLLAPGLARSPLDHLFYVPFKLRRMETIEHLLGFMIQQSDNTATDVLLDRLGGIPAVAAFVENLGVRGFHFKRTFAQLVDFYFGLRLPAGRRPHMGKILAAIRRLRNPYIYRTAAEDSMIAAGDDCCTPRAMTDLLTVLANGPEYALALSHMVRCAGGRNRIRKALVERQGMVKAFGHKTGSLGGVANDAGIVQFRDGSFAAICIMVCRATVSMEVRDHQIAAAATAVMKEFEERS